MDHLARAQRMLELQEAESARVSMCGLSIRNKNICFAFCSLLWNYMT